MAEAGRIAKMGAFVGVQLVRQEEISVGGCIELMCSNGSSESPPR